MKRRKDRLALRRRLAPAQKGGGVRRRSGRGLFQLRHRPPIAPLGAMTPLEVQVAQTLSVMADIVFAFLLVVLVCVGGGRAVKALSDGGSWDLGGHDCCCHH